MDSPQVPKQLPSPTHEVIVVLEQVHLAMDHFDTGSRSHEVISYHRISKADEIRSRVQYASIIVVAQAFITAESLGEAPYLKCVVTPTSGTNHIDLDECKRRGVRVARCLGSSSPAVAEHALSLYFAARRKTVMLHNEIRAIDEQGENSWKRQHTIAAKMQMANQHPPCSIEEEIVGIIGHGHIGRRLESLCKALGMKVLISERKSAPARDGSGRTPFDQVIRTATVLFVSCVSNASTRHMIDAAELSAMRPEAVIVNVSRGNVLNSMEVIKALREQRISGAAADVFDQEPASTEEDSAFLAKDTKDLNLTFSPHVGYFSSKTVAIMTAMVKQQIKNFVDRDFTTFDV